MPETFLILLAGGILLAAAIPNPKDVTLLWLRLAGIISLSLAALSLFFYFRRDGAHAPTHLTLYIITLAAILAQLAFVQISWRAIQRIFDLLGYAAAVATAVAILPRNFTTSALTNLSITLALAGIAAMTGIVLMDMLLGHAYLTASKMSMKPFARLNASLALVAVARLLTATLAVYYLNSLHPMKMLWGIHGLLMLTRWLVGLAVPFVFIYMAHDCIKRRATQSATGILYVCGILIFIGEMIALPLVRDTGLPF
jgi:hypothetical protein